jgi:hypothetical protein
MSPISPEIPPHPHPVPPPSRGREFPLVFQFISAISVPAFLGGQRIGFRPPLGKVCGFKKELWLENQEDLS